LQFGPVNWPAIAVSVIAYFLIGGLWYSPALFVRPWLKMSGVNKQLFDAGLPKALLGDLLSAIAMSVALNQVMRWSGAIGLGSGLLVSVVVWVGFVASVLLTQVTYERRPFAFFAISAGYRFATLMAMGVILSIWR
jgi:hypothetical protein